jgi:hypothetical protein
MPFDITCLECSTPFRARTRRRSYCSRECASTATNRNRRIDRERPEKRCPRCDTVKPRDEFYKNANSIDGMTSWCQPCTRAAAADRRLKDRYGITEGDYDALLAAQGGSCAICRSAPTGKKLHVDHNHETGVVRELLCGFCNFLVGWVESRPDRLAACRSYLDRHGD